MLMQMLGMPEQMYQKMCDGAKSVTKNTVFSIWQQ